MKHAKLLRLQPNQYRRHQFPPLAEPIPHDQSFDESITYQDSQIDLQQRLEQGFNQGVQQGHEVGVEEGKKQGFIEGQKAGFQQGFKEGELAGRQRFDDAITPIDSIIAHINQWQQDKEVEQRQLICELVQKVAQQVIRAELTLMPQQILALVDETLSSLSGKVDDIVVELNPQDLERIQNIKADISSTWRLVANKSLPIGGCHVITDSADADVSADSRLETCMETVRDHLLDVEQPLDTLSHLNDDGSEDNE